MSSKSIPPPLRDLLAKLEFFAMIERGNKVCLHDMTFVDSTSWTGAYKRSVNGEGRKSLIAHINSVIDSTVDAIQEYGKTEFLSLIINGLYRAKNGIINLISTYTDSPDMVVQLRIILANIQLQLDKNRSLISGMEIPSNTSLLGSGHLGGASMVPPLNNGENIPEVTGKKTEGKKNKNNPVDGISFH